MIYLDNAATTKPCGACVEAMTEALTLGWANPSALYHFGVEAARLLRKCRTDVAQALGGETDRVFFTSGGTEADTGPFSVPQNAWTNGASILLPPVWSIPLSASLWQN